MTTTTFVDGTTVLNAAWLNDANAVVYGGVTTPAALAASTGAGLVGFLQSGVGALGRTTQSKLRDVVSVKDFGALGDGTGATPASLGQDISNAVWNTWDGTPFKTNLSYSPYGTSGSFVPPRAKPFNNSDTWDYIGITLALWQTGATYIPQGKYIINLTGLNKGAYNGLLIMRGQEQVIYGDGPGKTYITTAENAAFFSATNVGINEYYKLFTMYRVGGPPTTISEIGFTGPVSYSQTANNLTLVTGQNVNGVMFKDNWLTVAHRGLSYSVDCSDSHMKGVTTEYLFGDSVYTDSTSELSMDFCNFWASSLNIPNQNGVTALGRTSATNCRFVQFFAKPFSAVTGIFSNNYVLYLGTQAVAFTDKCVISGNEFTGTCLAPLVSVVKNASIAGNTFKNTDQHECIGLGDGTASSATNIVITGNTFVKTDATVAGANFAITALQQGAGYTQAATSSCIISDNTFQGRAMQALGAARFGLNTFDGTSGSQGVVSFDSLTVNGVITTSAAPVISTTNSAANTLTGMSIAAPGTNGVNLVFGASTTGSYSWQNNIQQNVGNVEHQFWTYNTYAGKYSGNAWFQGNNSASWSVVSDVRIKQQIRPIESCLNKILALKPCYFEYKNAVGQEKTGFIAQEFELVFPDKVHENEVPEEFKTFIPEGKLKSIDADLLPYLVGALQELSKRLQEAEAKLSQCSLQVNDQPKH